MMVAYQQKITFGALRASGVRDVLIYCRDNRCSHRVEANADGWADDVRLSDIEPRFTCTRCGQRGTDIRPKFPGGTDRHLLAKAWKHDPDQYYPFEPG